MMLIKLDHDNEKETRPEEQTQMIVRRLKGLLGQFTTENRIYDDNFIYDAGCLMTRLLTANRGIRVPLGNDKSNS